MPWCGGGCEAAGGIGEACDGGVGLVRSAQSRLAGEGRSGVGVDRGRSRGWGCDEVALLVHAVELLLLALLAGREGPCEHVELLIASSLAYAVCDIAGRVRAATGGGLGVGGVVGWTAVCACGGGVALLA